jgi:hypothetical protein
MKKAQEAFLTVPQAASKYAIPERTILGAIHRRRLLLYQRPNSRQNLVRDFDMFMWRAIRSGDDLSAWLIDGALKVEVEALRKKLRAVPIEDSLQGRRWSIGNVFVVKPENRPPVPSTPSSGWRSWLGL